MTRDVASIDETLDVARDLARRLTAPCVVALFGDLGAGKTLFVRGLVDALGGDARQVSSPTYVLLHVYETGGPRVFHLDAYRLGGSEELDALGFDEWLDSNAIVAIEWPQRVIDRVPDDAIRVHLDVIGESSRRIRIEGLS